PGAPLMTVTHSPVLDLDSLVAEAQTVHERLEALWADEGVDQLQIFLDPKTYAVLAEIKAVSMDFIARVAGLRTGG
ncbi:MAG: hypothetical protein RMN24_16025, partial [Anaerolineae bacterium]|nr:hypothetical protein [Anaerolineae bacterium]